MNKKKRKILSAAILSSLLLVSNLVWAQETPGLAIGTNSIAQGTEAVATGSGSIAIGKGAVATGDNLTGAAIEQKLTENKALMQNIEALKLQVNNSQLDFDSKYEIYNRVKAAEAKIAENIVLINNTLKPALTSATTNYNNFKPQHDSTVADMNDRLGVINNLNFSLLVTDPTNGLNALAQELKTKTETGYSFQNDIGFYKTYIQNYITAKGELANNKAIAAEYNTSSQGSEPNSIYNPSAASIRMYAFDMTTSLTSITVPYVRNNNELTSGAPWNADSKVVSFYANGSSHTYYIDDRQATMGADDIAKWNTYKQTLVAQGNNIIDLSQDKFITPAIKQSMKDNLAKKISYIDATFGAKYEQGEYNKYKAAGDDATALLHLQKKIAYEVQANNIKAAIALIKPMKDRENEFNAWHKANITDIENSNTLTVNTLRNQFLAAIADKQAQLDDLSEKVKAAEAAVKAKEKENAQLEPSQSDKLEAAKAQAAKDKLEAGKAALEAAKSALALNNLKNVGENAIAYGTNALVTGKNAIGIGTNALVTGEDSVGIGHGNTVSGTQATAIGISNTVAGDKSGATGNNNAILATKSYAIGNDNHVTAGADNNFIVGNNVQIMDNTIKNSIALGNDSTVEKPNAVVGYAGGVPVGVVSIGAQNKERQITHVAAGRISDTSTDAVNGSQLYKVANASISQILYNKSNGQLSVTTGQYDTSVTTLQLQDYAIVPGNYTINKDGQVKLSSKDKFGANIEEITISDVASKSQQDTNTADITVLKTKTASHETKIANLDGRVTTIEGSITNINKDIAGTVKYDKDANGNPIKEKITLGGTGGTTITNVKAGELSDTSTDAVNGNQLNATNKNVATNTTEIAKVNSKINAGWIASIDGTDVKTIKPDDNKLNFLAGINITLTNENGAIKISSQGVSGLDKTAVHYDKDANGNPIKEKITLGGTGGTTITNVKAGELSDTSTDAVTGKQLHETNKNLCNLAGGLERLSSKINKVGAGAAALASLHPLDYDPDNKLNFAASAGHYSGSHAFAIGAFFRPAENFLINFSAALGNGANMYSVGLSFGLDKRNSVSKRSLYNSVKSLEEENKELRDRIRFLYTELRELKEKITPVSKTPS